MWKGTIKDIIPANPEYKKITALVGKKVDIYPETIERDDTGASVYVTPANVFAAKILGMIRVNVLVIHTSSIAARSALGIDTKKETMRSLYFQKKRMMRRQRQLKYN